MKKYPLLSKTLVIGLLTLLLTGPLLMVRDLVNERSYNRNHAETDVARASAGEQTVVGPVMYVPYTETFPVTVPVAGKRGGTRVEMHEVSIVDVVFPDSLDLQSRLDTEVRWRGIFPVTVFNSTHNGQGTFTWKAPVPGRTGGKIKLGQALVLMGVSDVRGLQSAPQLQVGGQSLVLSQVSDARAPLPLGVKLPASVLASDGSIGFDLKLELAGTRRLGWVPLGDENTVSLTSSWPHPSFSGSFLPRTRTVNDDGFSARWRVTSLSSQAQAQFAKMARNSASAVTSAVTSASTDPSNVVGVYDLAQDDQRSVNFEQFSVSLEDPVDVYRLTDRATKYGTVFIVLTFAAFFVLEMIKRWRIHPIQYLMVGAALVLFFLLLLSLSEHLPFTSAYAIASAACVALQSYYLRHVLGNWRSGFGMSAMLIALYGVLYGILISEDNALMMGSLLLFGVLAAIMVATRRLDWYSVMNADDATAPASTKPLPVVPDALGDA